MAVCCGSAGCGACVIGRIGGCSLVLIRAWQENKQLAEEAGEGRDRERTVAAAWWEAMRLPLRSLSC
jgi:hypothetical protein